MRVLIENAAGLLPKPFGWREEEHVVPVAVRPIGHRHASSMGSDEATHENENQRRGGREQRKRVEDGVVSRSRHDSYSATDGAPMNSDVFSIIGVHRC